MDTLFPDEEPRGPVAPAPLAERMRPRTFDEFVGQQDLLARGKPLREAIERDLLQSIILWGPPGTGKTTLARIIADTTRARFVSFSAVLAGIKEIRDVMGDAERLRRSTGRRTIVFIDEIHRFNKAQQDAFLPRVEAGDIVLIGSTTSRARSITTSSRPCTSRCATAIPTRPSTGLPACSRRARTRCTSRAVSFDLRPRT